MKNISLFILSLFAFATAYSQESTWKISLNNKVLYTGNADNPGTAVLAASAIVKAKGTITITYNMEKPQEGWNRTIYLNDANDNVIKQYELKNQVGTVTIPVKIFQQIAKKKQAIHIHTMSLPKDPNLAAVVRVRRVLLGKIQWQ